MKIITDFFVNPPREWFLTDILFYAPPKKIVYKSGESFDTEGLVVQAIYNNNLREKVSNYTYSPTAPLVDSDKAVTISFTDGGITKTRDITIVVLPVLIGIEVTTMPDKTVYTYGEMPDYTGMVVTAKYSNGTTKIVIDYSVSTASLSELGSVGLTVSYTEDGVTFTDDVPITVGPAMISAFPTQANSLTYNGVAQSPTWNGYDTNQLTLDGITSAANAGDYEVVFTPKYGFCWPDNTTTAKTINWSINKAQIGSMPAQNGSLTYNGSAQIPTWDNYDTTQLTLDGDTSGTNAGTYTVSFTPTANYEWSDNTTVAKSTTWSIGKALPTLILSTTNIELNTNNSPYKITYTINTECQGSIGLSSANDTIADIYFVSGSDGNSYIEVTAIGDGSTSLFVEVEETDNFLSNVITISVSVNLSSLPNNYEEIEWIQSGAQNPTTGSNRGPYIKTGIVPTKNTKIQVTFACCGNVGGRVFGSSGNNTTGYFELIASSTDIVVFFTDLLRKELTTSSSLNSIHTVTLDATNNTAQLDDDNSISLTYNTSKPLGNGPEIGLFASYIDDARPFHTGDIRIYSCKIWQDDILVRDFIPVMETSNTNNVCMYDKVTKKLFENDGIGHFISPIPYDYESLLPSEYTRVEYISNPNGGYTNNTLNNVSIQINDKSYSVPAVQQTRKCKIEFIANNNQLSTGEAPLMGFLYYHRYRASASSSTYYSKSYANELLYYSQEDSFGFRYGYSTSNIYGKETKKIQNPGGILEITFSNEQQIFRINNTEISLQAYGDKTTTYQSYIGTIFGTGWYYSTSSNPAVSSKQFGTYTTNYKLYEYSISVGNLAYLYFIPCISPDGVVGLYEVINGNFYSSNASGKPFVAGPEV